jgi:hypothetical protein
MKLERLSYLSISRLYPQELFVVLISVRGWVKPRDTVRQEGLCQRIISMTPLGIEPATFRLVALFLNQLRHRYKYSNNCNSVCKQATAYIWTVDCRSSRNHQIVAWYQNVRPIGSCQTAQWDSGRVVYQMFSELCQGSSSSGSHVTVLRPIVMQHHYQTRAWISQPHFLLTSWLQCSFSDKVIITLSCCTWLRPLFT